MADPFDDASLLLERAQQHIRELNQLAHGRDSIWSVGIDPDVASGQWVYVLRLDRNKLRRMTPIAADAANNLIHALDHVATAAYRLHEADRNRKIYFPIDATDSGYRKKEESLEQYLRPEWIKLFAAARARYRHQLEHIQTLKELSNTSKHWALAVNNAGALGITIERPNGQQIFDIPKGHFPTHDRYEFFRADRQVESRGHQVLISLTLSGIENQPDASIDTIFSLGPSFVSNVIAEAKHLHGA